MAASCDAAMKAADKAVGLLMGWLEQELAADARFRGRRKELGVELVPPSIGGITLIIRLSQKTRSGDQVSQEAEVI